MELFPPPSFALGPSPAPKKLLKSFDLRRPIKWLGDDGRNVFIEIQGQFAAVAIRKGPLAVAPPLRGECQGFSAASRLRMFKTINRLEFERAGLCTFATQTWRDELGRPEPEKITQARSQCQRSLERLAGKKLSGLWRIEWKLRLSGRYLNKFMPHLHVIYFDIPWIDKDEWTKAWAQAIGSQRRVSVKLKKIVSLRQTLYYVSKYIAKLDCLSNLDIPSYLNRYLPGRKWGVYRKNLLPVADKTEVRVCPGELVERLRAVATEAWKDCPQVADQGFTVFGPAAHKIQAIIDEYSLTQPDEAVES